LKLILSGKRLFRITKCQPKSLGDYELNQHKPWFDEGCLKLLNGKEQAKLQWLEDPSEINGDNLNNVRRESNRHYKNKKEGISEREN
jgi:hypothetical protein